MLGKKAKGHPQHQEKYMSPVCAQKSIVISLRTIPLSKLARRAILQEKIFEVYTLRAWDNHGHLFCLCDSGQDENKRHTTGEYSYARKTDKAMSMFIGKFRRNSNRVDGSGEVHLCGATGCHGLAQGLLVVCR